MTNFICPSGQFEHYSYYIILYDFQEMNDAVDKRKKRKARDDDDKEDTEESRGIRKQFKKKKNKKWISSTFLCLLENSDGASWMHVIVCMNGRYGVGERKM